MPKFSIIIPAYNEEKVIGKTIKSLRRLGTPRGDYEIIVADNNSTDHTSKEAKKAGADKVILETKKGTNLARQAGFAVSSGEIAVFLDADSVPPTDWLSRIEYNLQRKGVVMTTGPYDYGFKGFRAVLERWYTGFLLPIAPSILRLFFRRKAGIIIEGNFAAWRWAIEKIGGLPPIAFWGDGPATAMLITRRVGKIFFDSELKVKSSPRRFEEKGFFRLALRYELAYLKMYFSSEYK